MIAKHFERQNIEIKSTARNYNRSGRTARFTGNPAIGIDALEWLLFEILKLNPAGFVGEA